MIPPALWASIVKNVKVFRQHWILTLAMAALPAGNIFTFENEILASKLRCLINAATEITHSSINMYTQLTCFNLIIFLTL